MLENVRLAVIEAKLMGKNMEELMVIRPIAGWTPPQAANDDNRLGGDPESTKTSGRPKIKLGDRKG